MNTSARIGLVAICLSAAACQTPAIVRTARTLPKGQHDVSLAVNVTRVSYDASDVDEDLVGDTAFTYPNFVPDVLFNYGITDDFEFGGRLSLGTGALEANVKYRYFQSSDGKLHMAAAPALGYRSLFLVDGFSATLPLLFTYDVAPLISISGGPLASYTIFDVDDDLEGDDVNIGGDTLFAGVGVGVEFRTRQGFHIMPGIEYQRSISRNYDDEVFGDVDAPALNFLFIGVTLGWGPRERAPVAPAEPESAEPESAEPPASEAEPAE